MWAIPKLFRRDESPLRPPGARDEATFKAMCIRCGNCVRACPSEIIKRDTNSLPTSYLSPAIRYPRELYTDRYCLETCHKCAESCPTGAIEQMTLEQKNARVIGLAVLDIPNCLVSLDQNCGVCMGRCPQEAIEMVFCQATYVNSIAIDSSRCNGCGSCLTDCPVEVITIERV